jgi:translation initiation factor 2D
VVTKVSGLEPFFIVPETLAGECNKLFAASTTVGQLPGKNAGKVILIFYIIGNTELGSFNSG